MTTGCLHRWGRRRRRRRCVVDRWCGDIDGQGHGAGVPGVRFEQPAEQAWMWVPSSSSAVMVTESTPGVRAQVQVPSPLSVRRRRPSVVVKQGRRRRDRKPTENRTEVQPSPPWLVSITGGGADGGRFVPEAALVAAVGGPQGGQQGVAGGGVGVESGTGRGRPGPGNGTVIPVTEVGLTEVMVTAEVGEAACRGSPCRWATRPATDIPHLGV